MMGERAELPANWSQRPDEWIGGEGEAAASSYLQSPKTKLKTSWLKTNEPTEEPEEKDNAEATRRKTISEVKLPEPEKATKQKTRRHTEMNPSGLEKSDDDVLHLQREKFGYIAERPDDWLSGAADSGYDARSHKTKLKTSWTHTDVNSSEGMSQSLSHLSVDFDGKADTDPMHSSAPHLLQTKKERRQTSPLILQRLSLIKQKSEENHKANEFWVMHGEHHHADGPLVRAMAASEKEKALQGGSDHSNPGTSMRDDASGATKLQDLNSSDSVRRPRTSSLVQEKLQGINKQNEENHKKNEEFAAVVAAPKPKPPKASTDEASKDKEADSAPPAKDTSKAAKGDVRLQRKDHNNIALRPDDWLGGGSGHSHERKKVISIAKHEQPMSPPKVVKADVRLQRKDHHGIAARPDDWLGGGSGHSKESKESSDSFAKEVQHFSPTTVVKQDVRLQRKDHNGMALRPDDWVGGGSATASPVPLGSAKDKAMRRKTSPFVLQNPLVQ